MSIFSKLEREIKKGISRLGDSIKKGINDLGHEVRDGISKAGHEVESGVKSTGESVKREVHGVARKATSDIEHLAIGLKDDIEDLGEKCLDELEENAKAALEAIFSEITRAGFQKALGIIRKAEKIGETALMDAGFSINLSFLNLAWGDLGGRVGEIREKTEGLINKPPKLNRDYVIEVVTALSPDKVGLALDVKIAALVVTSDDLAVGFNFEVSTPAFLEASDELLEVMGL